MIVSCTPHVMAHGLGLPCCYLRPAPDLTWTLRISQPAPLELYTKGKVEKKRKKKRKKRKRKK